MCGIAGRILPEVGPVGQDLVKLMAAQEHRGADSTGFALYGPPLENGYVVRAMATSRSRLSADLDDFLYILRQHGSDFIEEPSWDQSTDRHVSVRMLIRNPDNLADWSKDADEISSRIEIQSVGRSLEIIKDTGCAQSVAEKHRVNDMVGSHGLGHARLATESSVLPTASHPFWARPFADVAIVHNGQITNYFTWREQLQRRGYRFMTENDSELIAVWISDQMSRGLTQQQALSKSIVEIDGVFTYLISDRHGIGFAKDRFAIKPLVTVEDGGQMAAATEEQAVRVICNEKLDVTNYDGPGQTRVWSVNRQRAAA